MSRPDWTRATWRTSARSGNVGNCVQVAVADNAIGVRDSKDPDGAILEFTIPEWRAFVDGAKDGEFDR